MNGAAGRCFAALAVSAPVLPPGVAAASAEAAKLSVPGTCFVAGRPVPVSGVGFTPGGTVSLTGDVSGSVVADTLGAFTTRVTAPAMTQLRPRRFSVAAVDTSNPAATAPPVSFPVVRSILDGNYAEAISGPPRQRTTWRFAGFAPGRPVYGHFRHAGRRVRNYRFGVAHGVCGTLMRRAPRAPVGRLDGGRWEMQIDQARRFRARTRPRRTVVFRIVLG